MALTQVAGGMLAGSITSSQITSVSGSTITGTQNIPKATLPTGSVLQVAFGSYNSRIQNSTTSYADTGLTVSITPQFSTSKILVFGTHADCFKNAVDSQQSIYLQLQRNGSTIYQICDRALLTVTVSENLENISFNWLDSPATTSAITYKTVFKAYTSNGFVTVQQQSSSYSTITAMEISA
jgi:hypothetical protein